MTIKHLYPAVEPSLNLDFANSKKLDSRITFTRGSIGTYVGEDGLIKTAAANQARFDHDTDGNSLGLLIEEDRTNLITHSEDTTQSAWSQPRSTSTVGGTAPDGTNTANDVTVTVTGSNGSVNQTFTLSGSVSYSVFIKKKGFNNFRIGCSSNSADNIYYDIDTDTFSFQGSNVNDPESKVLPDGWVRISAVFTLPSPAVARNYLVFVTDNSNSTYTTVNGTDGFYMWGAQVEANSFPTSYIPTSGSTVTRSADVASMTGTNFSSWYNQSEGTWVAGLPIPAKQSNSRVFTGGTEIWADPTPRITAVRTGSSTNYISVTHPVIAAAAYNSSTCFGAAGGLLSANVGGTLTTPTQMIIGRSTAAGVGYINVPISRLTYYPTRLPDATLQALTL